MYYLPSCMGVNQICFILLCMYWILNQSYEYLSFNGRCHSAHQLLWWRHLLMLYQSNPTLVYQIFSLHLRLLETHQQSSHLVLESRTSAFRICDISSLHWKRIDEPDPPHVSHRTEMLSLWKHSHLHTWPLTVTQKYFFFMNWTQT